MNSSAGKSVLLKFARVFQFRTPYSGTLFLVVLHFQQFTGKRVWLLDCPLQV
jgi:hypothetical protein